MTRYGLQHFLKSKEMKDLELIQVLDLRLVTVQSKEVFMQAAIIKLGKKHSRPIKMQAQS